MDADGGGPAGGPPDARTVVRQPGGGVPPELGSRRDGGPTESGTDGSGRAGQQFGIWCFRAPNRRRNEEVPGAERCGGGNDPEAVGGDCAATLSAGSSQCGCFE